MASVNAESQSVTARGNASGIRGVLGAAFVDLGSYLDLGQLDAIHEEICLGLTQVPVAYTGGGHRSMGIVPPSLAAATLVDYGEVIRGLSDDAFALFRSLADDPASIPDGAREHGSFGEEREHPLSRRQMLWLKLRHGVYFPWKVYLELIPNQLWSDKSVSVGKDFTRLARSFFPRTIEYVKSLPFESIGRCNIMGLEAHDHGTVHRDGDPEDGVVDHFVTFCPAGDKRIFLWDEERREKTYVTGRAYWFNDRDYHGVEADPFFRYSVRVDGVFRPDFLSRLPRLQGSASSPTGLQGPGTR